MFVLVLNMKWGQQEARQLYHNFNMTRVKSAISGTSGSKGLPDIAIFYKPEYYT
jgi:hypothetical protein